MVFSRPDVNEYIKLAFNQELKYLHVFLTERKYLTLLIVKNNRLITSPWLVRLKERGELFSGKIQLMFIRYEEKSEAFPSSKSLSLVDQS